MRAALEASRNEIDDEDSSLQRAMEMSLRSAPGHSAGTFHFEGSELVAFEFSSLRVQEVNCSVSVFVNHSLEEVRF